MCVCVRVCVCMCVCVCVCACVCVRVQRILSVQQISRIDFSQDEYHNIHSALSARKATLRSGDGICHVSIG